MSHKKNTGNDHPQQSISAPEKSRRRVLKNTLLTGGIIAGSNVLPQKWTRPMVDSVILPSHAATTDDSGSAGGDITTTPTPTVNYYFDISGQDGASLNSTINNTKSFAERALDVVIPTASAKPRLSPIYICLAISGNSYTGRVIIEPYSQSYQDYNGISGTVGIGLPLTSPAQPCFQTGIYPPTMTVDNVTPTSCRCSFTSDAGSAQITVKQNECGQPNLICRIL